MRRYLAAKRRETLCIYESVAAPTHGSFETEAKIPVRVLEEYRHLQFRIRDVLSNIGDGMRDPQSLRHHGSSTHDHTVEYPSGLVRCLILDMVGNGRDNEENASLSRMTRGGYVISLQ
jgi:hypothetical protein